MIAENKQSWPDRLESAVESIRTIGMTGSGMTSSDVKNATFTFDWPSIETVKKIKDPTETRIQSLQHFCWKKDLKTPWVTTKEATIPS